MAPIRSMCLFSAPTGAILALGFILAWLTRPSFLRGFSRRLLRGDLRSIKHIWNVQSSSRSFLYSAPAHWSIISIMAALAHGFEIVIGAILWRVVKVGNRQDHNGAGIWMRASPASGADDAVIAATFSRAFAFPIRPHSNPKTNLFPVFRISRFVFRTNRHQSSSPAMRLKIEGSRLS